MGQLTKPTAIDCFAGAGGLSLGLKRAGFDVRAAFDFSEPAIRTYQTNFGDYAQCIAAENIEVSKLLSRAKLKRGDVDLVAGGPPCQGFSVQRRGTNVDPRNKLMFKFLQMIEEIRPRFFLMENVSAIRGPRGNALLIKFSKAAENAGYHIEAAVLNAADFGVAQNRRRYFMVGKRRDVIGKFEFPAPKYSKNRYRSVQDAIGDLPSPGTPAATRIANHELGNMSAINRLRISFVPPGGGRADIPAELQLPCHAAAGVDVAGHRSVYGRLHWDHPAGTITTKCNSFTRGRFAHPSEDRNITMREAARLQGFPDNFVFQGNRVDVAHQIGNAVPPALAEHLGRSILAVLERSAEKHILLPTKRRPHLLNA
jgi:DNA (cytosine-5)-methyltransferase 1